MLVVSTAARDDRAVLGLTEWANYGGLGGLVYGLYGDTTWTCQVN